MYQHNSKRKALEVAVACGYFAGAQLPALAQETGGIQEVVVTAEKREQNLQTTPIAISAFSSESLEKLGVTSFEGVAKNSPSLSFTPYPSSSNLLILYMRGQGVSDPMQITSDGSVGLYSDGFYISRPQASTFDLADVERVEVLRGPQGTLYGRNTTGGAVNLISKKPTGEFGFKQDLTFGTRNQFRSLTSINLPKVANISSKISLLKSSIDGHVKNTGSGRDYGEQEQFAGRLSLHWEIADNFTIDYFGEAGSLDSTPVYYQNSAWSGRSVTTSSGTFTYPYGGPQSKTYRPVDLKMSTSDFEGHGLTLSWDVNDSLTLKSLTGHRKLDWHAYQDYVEAFAFISVTQGTAAIGGIPLAFTSNDLVRDRQFSQEFQAIGSFLDKRIEYVAGLYYFEEDGSHFERVTIPTFFTIKDRDVQAYAESKAIYLQVTATPPIFEDRLKLTVGARYTKDDRTAERDFIITAPMPPTFAVMTIHPEQGKATGSNNDDSFSRFNPSFTASFNWTDDLSTYAKVATGYKAGGSSSSGQIGKFNETFSPEKVTTFELGLKSYWWDRRVRLNTAVFASKFDDMQLAFTVDAQDSSVVQSINAGEATVAGAEIELLFMPIDDLSFNLEYSYLDAEFDKVEAPAGSVYDKAFNSASPYAAGDNIKDSFVLPYAPEHSISAGADYTFFHFDGGDLSARLSYRYQSRVYNTANDGPAVPNRELYSQPGYGLLDGRITAAFTLPRGDHARVSLWAKNLLNKEYKEHVIGQGGLVNTSDVPLGLVNQAVAWAPPPSYGIDLTYEY